MVQMSSKYLTVENASPASPRPSSILSRFSIDSFPGTSAPTAPRNGVFSASLTDNRLKPRDKTLTKTRPASCPPPQTRLLKSPKSTSQPKPRAAAEVRQNSLILQYDINSARIEAEFAGIEYGKYDGRAACMIHVDLHLMYIPKHTIAEATVNFRFGLDGEEAQSGTRNLPGEPDKVKISRDFYPREYFGPDTSVKETSTNEANIGVNFHGISIAYRHGTGKEVLRQRHWQVQGRDEAARNTFQWTIMQNEESGDSVPRKFRVGMVVYLPQHSGQGIWVETSVKGKLRNGFWKNKRVERRYLNPPGFVAGEPRLLGWPKEVIAKLKAKRRINYDDVIKGVRKIGRN